MEQPPRLVTITTGTYSKTVSLDDWGRLEELKDSRDQGLAFVYDASGRLRQKVGSLADKVASQATLDALGRLTTLDHYNAAGTTVLSTDTMTYDDAHLRTVSTDAEGRQQTREYASWGAPDDAVLIALTNPLGEVWMYGYEQDPAHGGNPYGQLSSIESPSDSALPQVQYTYNGQGLLASTVRADTGAVLYDYNTDGSLACVTDQDSAQTQTVRKLCYRYDGLNRVVNVEQVTPVAIASVQQIVYDERYVDEATGQYGRVTRTDRGNGSSTVTHSESYDVAGRLHTATEQIQGTPTAYSSRVVFNTQGEQTELHYPTGLRVTTAYDAASRPLTVTAAKPGTRGSWTTVAKVVTNVVYDDYHQIDSLSYGNKTTVEFDRDDKLRVSQYRVMNKDHYPQLHLQYTYNDADQITLITDLNSSNANRRSREYGYDAASRLTSELAIGLNRSVGYGYDSEHNVTTWTTADVNGSLGAEALSYEQQQLTQIEHLDKDGLMLSTEALDYNAAGELMAVARSSLMASSSSLAYSRNGRGWLTGVIANGGNSGTGYVYGPDGLRVAKNTPETATLTLRDPGGRIIAELAKVNGSYQVQTETVYGPLGLAAQLSNNRATVRYLHTDHVDTVLAVTGSNSYATANYDYDAWGNLLASSGSEAANPAYRIYATAPYDPESGLYQMGHRYYDPRVGRFIEPDPIVDATQDRDLNRYTYAHGDPVNKSDPSGLMEGNADYCFGSMDYYADCMQGLTAVPLLYKAAPAGAVASATGSTTALTTTAIENNGRLAVAAQVEQKPRLFQGGVMREIEMNWSEWTYLGPVLAAIEAQTVESLKVLRAIPLPVINYMRMVAAERAAATAAINAADAAIFALRNHQGNMAVLEANVNAAATALATATAAVNAAYTAMSPVQQATVSVLRGSVYGRSSGSGLGFLIMPPSGFDANGDPVWSDQDPNQL
jgi:RHS repeat-associated protein